MGVFEDQAKKMQEERRAKIEKEANLQTEQNNIAQSIMEDFIGYMNNAQLTNVSPSVRDNNVTIRVNKSSSSLTIACHGEDAFTVLGPGNIPLRQGQGVLTKVMMVRSVLEWLQTPLTTGDQWIDDEP